MIDLIAAKLVLDFGTVYYKKVENCTVPEIKCEQILEVIHDETSPRVLQLLRTQPAYARTLFDLSPESDRLEIIVPNYCHKIIFNRDKRIRIENIYRESGDAECFALRNGNAFVGTFDINSGIELEVKEEESLEELVRKLRSTDYLINHKIEIEKINNHVYFLYNIDPEKNIILNKNYWESIFIVITLEGYYATILIDGSYATGVNPPHPINFNSIPRDFRQATENFYLRLKQSVYG